MVSDAPPNASWHPALMPNSIADLPQTRPLEPVQTPAQEHGTAADVPPAAADGTELDAWSQEHDDGGDWMADADNNTPAQGSEPAADATPAENAEEALPDESSTASKHLSTMSFTRTVPHEVTWNDDDDAEWTLERTATDPFKFMPDSDRTNSFPPVPPLEKEEDEATPQLEQPVAFTQAEHLASEIEGGEKQDDEPSPNAVMGASQGTQGAGEEARFEEGVPLISSGTQVAAQQSSAEAGPDLFAEDAPGEEDDFFNSVRGDRPPQQDDFQPAPLERKSTTDVLQSMNVGPVGTGFTPLQETPEEAETDADSPQLPDTTAPPAQPSEAPQDQPKAGAGEDLDAKWKEMFGDEDDGDFLPDTGAGTTEVDPSAFLGSDDEGLLEDSEAEQPVPVAPPGSVAAPGPGPQANTQYLPQTQAPAAAVPPPNPYLPHQPAATPVSPHPPAVPAPTAQPPAASPYAHAPTAPRAPAQYGYGARPPPPQETKAQSFVDKAKGGYTSPYDLPMEVVKPVKRRTSAQPLRSPTSGPHSPATVPAPPRSASMYSQPAPPSSAPPGMARPASGHSAQPPPSARKATHESFFEDLPITTKPRPASRQSNRSAPSPTHPSPHGYSSQSVPPPATAYAAPPPGPPAPTSAGNGLPELVAPPRVNPYASLTTAPGLPPAVPAAAAARYSPAPAGASVPVPAPVTSRYSPAPPASRQPSAAHGPAPATPGQPILPHQPRTSSPLAHFEVTNEKARGHAPPNHAEGGLAEKRSSSALHESRLQRVPSLPPTREVEEEDAPDNVQAPRGPGPHPMSPPVSRYAPPPHARHTPPPSAPGHDVLSPPKRVMSSHGPLAPAYEFAPPPRSMTQSPGALYGNRAAAKPADPIPRPSSANGLTFPRDAAYPAAAAPSATSHGHPRGASMTFNAIPPTDGRELDPLERWRGTPLISWGVGGTLVTMFPKEVPRYGMNQSVPSVVRSPGEVKIQNAKDITPLEERLAKFPGPLKGKSRKKDTIAWLTSGIESLERGLPTGFGIQAHPSHEEKRALERVLLWKTLRVFIEHDGALEGNPAVEKAVRDILYPGLEASESAPPYMNGAASLGAGVASSVATAMQSDGVSSSAVEQIRRHLLSGEREKAIWAAADQRLWGHALLMSNALAPNLYKQVSQEFIKKEVNFPGHSNESLAALYEVLAGNQEESVDELVPSHARAGLQLVATSAASGPAKDAAEGLDKWRETLTLILSNRSNDDVRAINSLGALLSGYGRAEAAHICYIFGRSRTVFGGLDDPAAHFVLVGSDHKKQAEQFAKEIEPLLLSEVYEYGQSLAGSSSVPFTNPHLAAYKLQHALALAEYGFRDKALQYCDAIAATITSQTKRSPYYHPILENAVEDLLRRLKQAPREDTGSWIPKPSMNKVSDTMWSKFNKFVSGDDDGSGQGTTAEGETGPFARIAGGTPTISRSPSASNLETFGAAVPSYGMPAAPPSGPVPASAPPTRAASRYAPGAPQPSGSGSRPSTSAYAPRTSGELNRSSFEASRRSLEMHSGRAGSYTPVRSGSPAAMYAPYGAESSAPQQSPYTPGFQPAAPPAPASAPPQPAGYPAGPPNGMSANTEAEPASQSSETSGYQPPSYGYEPPSLTPYEAPAEEQNGTTDKGPGGSTYEPPSYQPYSYEPPSYEPESQPSADDDGSGEESKPKPKKKGIMYDDDDDDDFPAPKPAEKTKEEKDRENAEMFRKAAEEDAKRAEAAKQAKKGWGFTSWFGGKKEPAAPQEPAPNKPIRAKLGEPNSFYYDPELKRWVNKNAGPEDTAKKATPPPPKATPRSVSASPGPPSASGAGRASAPPTGPPRAASHGVAAPASASDSNLPSGPGAGAGGPPGGPPSGPPPGPVAMLRSASNTSTSSAPPLGQGPRGPSSLSNSSSIDDLLGSVGPRKPGAARKPKRGARYVDVMGKS